MATMQHKNFRVREFINPLNAELNPICHLLALLGAHPILHVSRVRVKTESATAVRRAFRLRFNIQPPTRKSIRRWNHQFEQIGCLCH